MIRGDRRASRRGVPVRAGDVVRAGRGARVHGQEEQGRQHEESPGSCLHHVSPLSSSIFWRRASIF